MSTSLPNGYLKSATDAYMAARVKFENILLKSCETYAGHPVSLEDILSNGRMVANTETVYNGKGFPVGSANKETYLYQGITVARLTTTVEGGMIEFTMESNTAKACESPRLIEVK